MVLHLELSVKRVHTAALVFLIFAGVSGVTAMPRAFAVSGTGWLAHPFTGVGWPSYYVEESSGHSTSCQTVVTSLVIEGVFERSAPQGRDRRRALRLVAGADLAARQVVRTQPQRGSTSEAVAVGVPVARLGIRCTDRPFLVRSQAVAPVELPGVGRAGRPAGRGTLRGRDFPVTIDDTYVVIQTKWIRNVGRPAGPCWRVGIGSWHQHHNRVADDLAGCVVQVHERNNIQGEMPCPSARQPVAVC